MTTLFGILLALVGLVLGIGGAWLITLGGSWYYLLAGAGMVIAGVQVTRRRMSGAWWFAAVLIGTVLWTIWEAGLDYWRWIPRLGLIVFLAFILALLLPRLAGVPSKAVSRTLAVLFVLVFVAAFALAFVPHGVTHGVASVVRDEPALLQLPPVDSAIVQPANAPAEGDWPAWGRSHAAMRFSPLTQITRDNVENLQRAWVYHTGDLPEERWGAETTPLKIDDTLYLCSGTNILIALDARTGEQRWRYDPEVPDENIPYTAACRGVAYYEVPAAGAERAADAEVGADAGAEAAADADTGTDTNAEEGDEIGPDATTPGRAAAAREPTCSPRIIEGTLDGRLIAVDAQTGTPCAGFGDNGQIDITRGMGQVLPGMVSITAPPTIVRGVVVTGHQVLDGQRRDAPSGVIQGYDAVTGELRWAWDMARPDLGALPPAGETYTRGTPNMWTTASADEQLGLVYLPMGNSAVDYWSGMRTPPENEYSTSLVALDVTTGKPAWHFQTVHVDVWDYDLGAQATLVDFPGDGGAVPAIILPTKQGDMYVLDRRTGEPLFGVEERPVPQGGVEPENRSPTQPFSLYHTLQKPGLTERDMWGITPFDQLYCRIRFRESSYEGMYTPPTMETHFVQYTGYNGGSDWGGIAVDPQRGVIIANYNDMPNHNELVTREEANRRGYAPRHATKGEPGGAEGAGDPQMGTPYAVNVNAGWMVPFTGLLCKEPPYGGIRAIDLATGRTIWDRPFGTARANGPFGIPSLLPIEIGTPNNGGSVVTASGLVFIAASTDNLIRAIDIETGETIWKDVLPAGGQANPMVYELDGREYLVIMAGGHHFMMTPIGDHVIAYALP
ncbi:MAG: membrane-bound PQQ-dependent dehydrogenase, glucose/quinate/shikimate family [Gammaproteobacteria bacterium]